MVTLVVAEPLSVRLISVNEPGTPLIVVVDPPRKDAEQIHTSPALNEAGATKFSVVDATLALLFVLPWDVYATTAMAYSRQVKFAHTLTALAALTTRPKKADTAMSISWPNGN